MKVLALIGAVLSAMAFASCGGSDTGGATTPATAGGEPQAKAEKRAFILSKAKRRQLPKITIGQRSGPPPRRLVVTDLREGTGAPLTRNDAMLVKYFSVRYIDAQKGVRTGAFPVARFSMSEVIDGWQVGLPGMRVGGQRELVVPPELHYPGWKQKPGRSKWTDVYVIDLLGVIRGGGGF